MQAKRGIAKRQARAREIEQQTGIIAMLFQRLLGNPAGIRRALALEQERHDQPHRGGWQRICRQQLLGHLLAQLVVTETVGHGGQLGETAVLERALTPRVQQHSSGLGRLPLAKPQCCSRLHGLRSG